MKMLTVRIRVEMEIPDDWQLVEHPSGIEVLKVGDQFVDFDVAPLMTRSTDPDAEWSDVDAETISRVTDTIMGIEAELEIKSLH